MPAGADDDAAGDEEVPMFLSTSLLRSASSLSLSGDEDDAAGADDAVASDAATARADANLLSFTLLIASVIRMSVSFSSCDPASLICVSCDAIRLAFSCSAVGLLIGPDRDK